jgi:serine/arginine repetitive matrix protein 2
MADIAEFSKESMHSGAERARERRRMEEEQREKDKERARRKAAELAAAAEAKKAEEDAVAEAEAESRFDTALGTAKVDGVQNVIAPQSESLKHPNRDPLVSQDNGPPTWRVRSRQGTAQSETTTLDQWGPPPTSRPTPDISTPSDIAKPRGTPSLGPSQSMPSIDASHGHIPPSRSSLTNTLRGRDVPQSAKPDDPLDSWRSKQHHPPPPEPLLPVVPEIPSVFDVTGEKNLQIVDSSDMGKLVGTEGQAVNTVVARLATEVVQESAPTIPSRTEHLPLRRGPPIHPSTESVVPPSSAKEVPRHPSIHTLEVHEAHPPTILSPSLHSTGPSIPSNADHSILTMSPRSLPLHSPTKHQFREASMSALDDVMSRIKGALSDIHPGESSRPVSDERKPSAHRGPEGDLQHSFLHARVHAGVSSSRQNGGVLLGAYDNFALSQLPRPASPSPFQTRSRPKVRLDRHRRLQEPISKRVLHLWKLPPRPIRWDILSWDPPVEGMSRKTLSRDEMLFSPSLEIAVALPKPRGIGSSSPLLSSTTPPRVQLPSGNADRRASIDRLPERENYPAEPSSLDPISRSPPPRSPGGKMSASLPKLSSFAPAPTSQGTEAASAADSVGRTKSVPKLPAGTDVAFYRPPTGVTKARTSSVNFTVSSELEVLSGEPPPGSSSESVTEPNFDGGVSTPNSSNSDGALRNPPGAKSPIDVVRSVLCLYKIHL